MIKKISALFASFIVSLTPLLVFVPTAHAATITWDGGTDGNYNFSDGENWVGDVAPGGGDVMVFPSGVTFNDPVNDLPGASFGGLEFSAIGGFECPHNGTVYDFSGSPIRLFGGISWQNDSCAIANFDGGIQLDGNVAIDHNDAADFSTVANVNLQTFVLSIFVNDPDAGISVEGLSGSGEFRVDGNTLSGVLLSGNNTSFSGDIVVYSGSLVVQEEGAWGTAAGETTVTDDADLFFSGCTPGPVTIDEPLVLEGMSSLTTGESPNPKFASLFGGCSGGGDEAYGSSLSDTIVNFTGSITLSSDVTFGATNRTTNITGPLGGAYSISMLPGFGGELVVNSSSNTSGTANGTYTATAFTKTLSDSQPAVSVGIYANNIIIIDGERGSVFVAEGGILKGTGTVAAINLDDGGHVAPGHSPGCLNSGNLTFVSGSTYDFEVGGTTACTEHDQIKVTGTVDLGSGTLNFIRYNGFTPAAAQTYMIVENDAADAVTGTFTNLAEGATFTVDGYVFRISYVGGSGNDVVITVQSVPATPNTGFDLLTAHPIVTFLTTSLLAGAIVLVARRYGKISTN